MSIRKQVDVHRLHSHVKDISPWTTTHHLSSYIPTQLSCILLYSYGNENSQEILLCTYLSIY